MQYVIRNNEYVIVDTMLPDDIVVPARPNEHSIWNGSEWSQNIDLLKQEKIKKLSDACTADIFSGFYSKAFDGVTEKHYDCELMDQTRVSGLVNVAQIVTLGYSEEQIKWKATGELECYIWTPQSMMQFGLDMKKHIEAKTDKYYALRIQVLNAMTENEINSITW